MVRIICVYDLWICARTVCAEKWRKIAHPPMCETALARLTQRRDTELPPTLNHVLIATHSFRARESATACTTRM
jgi:hypothetical protein